MGVRAVASPLMGLGQLQSAIWAVGFKASLDDKKMKTLAEETRNAAKAISRKDIGEAKRRLQSVKDGWVHHKQRYTT